MAVFRSLGGRNPVTGDYDADIEKVIIPEDVSDPTFLFDTDGVRLKFGSRHNVIEDGRFKYAAFSMHGYEDMANSLRVLTVPNDQSLVDNLINNGFFFIDYVKQHQMSWERITVEGVVAPQLH